VKFLGKLCEKPMGRHKIKNAPPEAMIRALEKDLEFIRGVASNHKNWDEDTARAVTKLIGWGSPDRVFKIGNKARAVKSTKSRDWEL